MLKRKDTIYEGIPRDEIARAIDDIEQNASDLNRLLEDM